MNAVDQSADDTPEARWRLFVTLLLAATFAPLVFFPVSQNFHPNAASIVAISAFMNFLGSGVHVGATGFFYADSEVRSYFMQNKWRYYFVPLLLVLGTGVVFFLVNSVVSAYLILAYFVWQTYHYQKQNYGILSFMAAATDRVRPTMLERAILQSSVWLGILGLIKPYNLAHNTVFERYTNTIHQAAASAFWVVPVLILAALVVSPALRRNGVRILFLAMGGFFYLPIFLFSNPVAAVSSYAIAHGLQYLVFMYFVGAAKADRDVRIIGLTAIALVAGTALALMGDKSLWGQPTNFIFGCYLGLVMSHFVVDAGIWKLREPFPRKYMGNAFRFVFQRGQMLAARGAGASTEIAGTIGEGRPVEAAPA